MNVPFNYIKFASYSAVPFVAVLAFNVAVIWRTVRVSPSLRRNVGGAGGAGTGGGLLSVDRQGSTSVSGERHSRTMTTVASSSGRSGSSQLPANTSASNCNFPGASITASQVSNTNCGILYSLGRTASEH